MARHSFPTCPFCGYANGRGFTSIEFRYDLREIWLSRGTFVEHKHIGIPLPEPQALATKPDMAAHRILDKETDAPAAR